MIRKATERDISAVAQIYSEIHAAEEQGTVTTGWLRDIYPTVRTAEKAVQNDELYVLEEEGVILAAARLNGNQEPEYADVDWLYAAEPDEVLVMHTLVVSPAASGMGYGRAFAAYYEETARRMGCRLLRIDTNARNLRARKLYAGLGYREAGIVPTTFNGIPGVDLVCLEKRIGGGITDERAAGVIGRICDLLRRVVGDDLLGVYVHGSLAFGCFSWETGDIDLIIVVRNEPDHAQKREIIEAIIDIEHAATEKGIEFSMLLEDDCKNFVHPMPYVMHYSKGYTARYLADMDGHIDRLRGTDGDLAAHLTVMHAVGFPVMGPNVPDVFSKVPEKDYLDSLMNDIGDAGEDIRENPVYVILNLCRVLAWLKEGCVLSKEEGGRWGIKNLPEEFIPIVNAALECYRTGGEMPCSGRMLDGFAGHMLDEIKAKAVQMMKG